MYHVFFYIDHLFTCLNAYFIKKFLHENLWAKIIYYSYNKYIFIVLCMHTFLNNSKQIWCERLTKTYIFIILILTTNSKRNSQHVFITFPNILNLHLWISFIYIIKTNFSRDIKVFRLHNLCKIYENICPVTNIINKTFRISWYPLYT